MIKFYQYRSAAITELTIRESTLKFTNPMDFNDPLDFHPTVPIEGFNKFVKRINGLYGEGRKKHKVGHKQRTTHLSNLRSDEFRRTYTKNFSVACFSKSPFILPMWAHYADDHKGCVIEFTFEESEELFNEYFNLQPGEDFATLVPLDVIYSNDRPPLFDNNGLTDSHITGLNSCLVKAKAWEYEQEVRVIKKKKSGIYKFDRNQITGVYFGMKIDKDKKKILSKLIDDSNNYTDTKIKKHDIKIAFDKFELSNVPFRL
ncbi:hypothetical protein C1N60_11805 [Pantoea sp. SGAir0184]